MKNKCAPVHILPTPTLPTPTSKTTITPSNNNYTDTSGASLAYLAYAESIRYYITLHQLCWITERIPTEIHFIGSLRFLHPTHTKHHPTHTTQPPTHWLTYGTNYSLCISRTTPDLRLTTWGDRTGPDGMRIWINNAFAIRASTVMRNCVDLCQTQSDRLLTQQAGSGNQHLQDRQCTELYSALILRALFCSPSMPGLCTVFTATCTLRSMIRPCSACGRRFCDR